MITIRETIKSGNAYIIGIDFDKAAELSALPSSTKPLDQDHFAVGADYGIPATNSYARCAENNKNYLYIGNAWEEAGKAYTLEEKTITQNGTYTPDTGKAYSKVTVNVTPEE